MGKESDRKNEDIAPYNTNSKLVDIQQPQNKPS